jgi:hypothetical protein
MTDVPKTIPRFEIYMDGSMRESPQGRFMKAEDVINFWKEQQSNGSESATTSPAVGNSGIGNPAVPD